MKTLSGERITRNDPHRHKFASAMAEYLAELNDCYDNASGDAECPTGWFVQFGRRILFGDERGFVWHETFPEAQGASRVIDALNLYYWEWSDEESDTSDAARMMNVDDRVVNEVCDNCGSPLVVVRSRAGRFCTSECAEAFELS